MILLFLKVRVGALNEAYYKIIRYGMGNNYIYDLNLYI